MSNATGLIGLVGGLPGLSPPVRPEATPTAGQGKEFSDLLASMATEAAGTIQKAETVSAASIQGKASVQEVVEAVMQAEQSLQTMMVIRDKVVSAYLDISRMQI